MIIVSVNWPLLVRKEYEHWEKENHCLNATELNSQLQLNEKTRFIEDRPPCFFAGRVGQSKILLISLNPGYKGKRKEIEYKVFNKHGWEETYFTFFDWFEKKGLSSQYYSRFAVFLSGYLGYESYPRKRKERYELLGENLVNMDLIPYHSRSFTNRVLKQVNMLKQYVDNLKEMIELADPDIVFLNGSLYSRFLPLLNITLSNEESFLVNEKYDRWVKVGLGSMDLDRRVVWFKNFLTGASLAATNDHLFRLGRDLRVLVE